MVVAFVRTPSGSGNYGRSGGGALSTCAVALPGLSGVRAIAAGVAHSLALLENGTAGACGLNTHGQLGNVTRSGRSTPVPVAG